MAGTHSAIGGALQLRALPGFSVDRIREIRVGTTEAMLHHGGFKLTRPATAIGAQMSHRYVVAVTLIDGALDLENCADVAMLSQLLSVDVRSPFAVT